MCNITTIDSFFCFPEHDIIDKCNLCDVECKQEISYVGIRCTNCRIVFNFETTLGEYCHIIRQRLGLTRAKFGSLLGYSPKTIKTYEFGIPSKSYYENVITEFRKFLDNRVRMDYNGS